MEFEADMYGLNAARQPDGEANVDLMLGNIANWIRGRLRSLSSLITLADVPGLPLRCAGTEHPELASPELARPLFGTP
jgi:hypothetical protein